jgi:class 3 adenylate cyclase
MADMNKMNRTWLCSVVFMDIVNYSSQSTELQIRWKERFNGYLANAIKDVPEDERVILDTGDGAATCFLGAPESAMFTALELWHSLLIDEREQQPAMRVRIGINLGPVKLVRDINGAANAIGDGMNAGQRVMSFAGENQILVSQSYFEVVSRLSDDYKNLFTLKGVEKDKHIREHTVYNLSPPGQQHAPVSLETPEQAAAVPVAVAAPPKPAAAPAPAQTKPPGSRVPLLVGGLVVVLVAVAAAWRFSPIPTAPVQTKSSPTPTASAPAAAPTPAPASTPSAAPPAPAPVSPAPVTAAAKPAVAARPVASAPEQQAAAPPPPRAAAAPPAAPALSAADQATARELRERYTMDASRAATARSNADAMRQRLAAKGMSLNAGTAAAVDNMQSLLEQANEALREHRWDDALSNLQAVEAQTQKVARDVGN